MEPGAKRARPETAHTLAQEQDSKWSPLSVYHVGGFVLPGKEFSGNPAMVVLLPDDGKPSAERMQQLAVEFMLTTVFVQRATEEQGQASRGSGDAPAPRTFRIRWFTPTVELPLCGHGTMTACHVLYSERLVPRNERVAFLTECGDVLECSCEPSSRDDTASDQSPRSPEAVAGKGSKDDAMIMVRLPLHPIDLSQPVPSLPLVLRALGLSNEHALHENEQQPAVQTAGPVAGSPVRYMACNAFHKLLVELPDESAIASLQPNWNAMAATLGNVTMVVATAKASQTEGVHFVSRAFAPRIGINEDHVCGSAHSMLAPYWHARLGLSRMMARQLSPKGGELQVLCLEDAPFILLGGRGVTTMRGSLCVSPLE